MLANFFRRYTFKQKISLFLEDHLYFILGGLPSYEGILIRRIIYRLLFKRIGKASIIFVNTYFTHTFNIIIGDYFAINCNSHLDGRGGIEIGDHVIIGPNVFIGSSNHVVAADTGKPRMFLGHIPEPVKIGSNVWIGANSVICPGAKIQDNSVIAAGSVVVGDIPASVLAAGNPAKIIKGI